MDKNKILDAAAKLVAKGAYDKAIKEYSKVLDADPKDVRVLHKLGELYEKKNDAVQAATFFTRVADSYANDGFSMKAIALFKKVLKLDASLIDVNLKLAELHQQHQLMSEAMAYYQAVANHHDKNGNVRASLDILKKMVDLDPENVASRIKLAELYARESMNGEALQEFRRAAEYLKRNSRLDDYLRVAERISTLDPDDLQLARELASQYLQKGDQKRALARLQVCFKADPRDVETLTLLAQAFHGLGQTSKTISVYKELAKLHAEHSRHDEANRVWAKVGQLDPTDPDFEARSAQRAPPPPAPQPQAQPQPSAAPAHRPPPAPQPQAAGGLSRDQLAKLLTETDVYVKYGLHDKALEHLRRIFAVDPENLDAHEKAYQIYVAANNAGAASEQLLNVLRLCTRREDVQRAQPYLATILQQNPNHPEVPAFSRSCAPGRCPSRSQSSKSRSPKTRSSWSPTTRRSSSPTRPTMRSAEEALAHVASLQDDEVVAEDVIDEPAFATDDEPLTMASSDDGDVIDPLTADIVVEDPAWTLRKMRSARSRWWRSRPAPGHSGTRRMCPRAPSGSGPLRRRSVQVVEDFGEELEVTSVAIGDDDGADVPTGTFGIRRGRGLSALRGRAGDRGAGLASRSMPSKRRRSRHPRMRSPPAKSATRPASSSIRGCSKRRGRSSRPS